MSGSSPSEADYHDIEAAIGDMSHGDWFLREYAKRHRQADTDRLASAIADLHRGTTDNERISFNLFALDNELLGLQRELGSLQICAQCAAKTEKLVNAIQCIQHQIAELITYRNSTSRDYSSSELPNQIAMPDAGPTDPNPVPTSPRSAEPPHQASAEDLIRSACAWLQQLGDSTDVAPSGRN
jgi:hypothetical protein